jgi:hypothetical protein
MSLEDGCRDQIIRSVDEVVSQLERKKKEMLSRLSDTVQVSPYQEDTGVFFCFLG